MHSNVRTFIAVRQKTEQSCFIARSCNVTSLQYDIVLLLLLMCHVWWEVIYLIFCHSVAVPISCYYNMAHLSVQ